MTIKTDHVVCLTLPKSLVGTRGPVEDVFLVWGWLGCKEQKLIGLAPVEEEFICMGPWECVLEIQLQDIQPRLNGVGILVLLVSWPHCFMLSFNCFILPTDQPLSAHPRPVAGVAAPEEWP